MKKKILFVVTNFRHGGTNKSLENLLSVIDKDKYQIEVFGMEHYGPYLAMFKNCSVLPMNTLVNGLISHLKDNKGVNKLLSFGIKLINKIANRFNIDLTQLIFNNVSRNLVKSGNYDTIISYSEGVPTKFLSNVKHTNKIAWVHCDYSSYMLINNNPNENDIYNMFHSIVCVSKYTKGEFLKHMNVNPEKVHYIHNILNTTEIINSSNELINDINFNKNKNNLKILTIGTFYPIKRLNHIPLIAKKIRENGNKSFVWYIIARVGDLNEFSLFKKRIKEFDLEDNVIYLGEKDNPYKYLKECDLFVTLSITEACPYVVNEAKVLNIPIVSTNFPSVYEFIKDEFDGLISPLDSIHSKIFRILNEQNLYSNIKQNLLESNFNNLEVIEQLNKLLDKK